MKRGGKILICLAGGLALCAISRAADLPGNPYASIVARNVFGLNPPTPVDNSAPATPPPKISLNGIMTIFGKRQALYKVAGVARPGKPAQDESYILGEGERQDDVEVTRIDEKNGMVTFDNHGVVQEIPLANGVATTAAAPAETHAPGRPNFLPRPGMRDFGRPGLHNFQNPRGNPMHNGNGSGGQPTGFNSAGQQNSYNSSSQPKLTGLDQQALIAAQHAEAIKENNPIAPLFPPTIYDEQARQAVGVPDSSQH